MKILATECKGKDLKAGDLFSAYGPEYWKTVDEHVSVGERVFIRTNTPCPVDQEEEEIYRITIALHEALG